MVAKLARKTLKLFASGAANNGQFGSAQAGTKLTSTDPAILQALSAWGSGWLASTISSLQLPPLEEMQAVQYVHSWMTSYLFQEGIPEYDAGTTYYIGGLCKQPGTSQIYKSITDNNIGHALTDTSNWQQGIDLGGAGGSPSVGRILYGLTASNSTGDSVNDLSFAAGTVVSDDGTTLISVPTLIKQSDAVFAAGTNAGGLDTGTVGNGTYYAYAISQANGASPDIIYSLSATGPTMPTGYTKKALIFAFIRFGSTIVSFTQIGDVVTLTDHIALFSASPSSTSGVAVSTGLPNFEAFFGITISGENNANPFQVMVHNTDKTPAVTPSIANAVIIIRAISASIDNYVGGVFECPTSATGQVTIRQSATNASLLINLSLRGYKVRR